MISEEPPSRKEELFDALAFLAGHLEVSTSHDRHAVNALHDKLAQALAHCDLAAVRDGYFSVESSDLFFAEAIAPQERSRLVQLADRIAKDTKPPDLRVFVRDVPVRTTQMPGSVPAWAGGAAVAEPSARSSARMDGAFGTISTRSRSWSRSMCKVGPTLPILFSNVSLAKKSLHIDLPAALSMR